MLCPVNATQRKVRVLAFRLLAAVSGTLNRTGIDEGTFDAKVTEVATGKYKLTYDQAFVRKPVVIATTMTDVTTVWVVENEVGYCTVECVGADGTTATADAEVNILVWGFDSADKTGPGVS